MPKKRTKKTPTHRHFYELIAYHEDDTGLWDLAFTWTQDGVEMITVTTADVCLEDAIQTARDAIRRAQMDLRNEQLILPDMGDFQIKYWPGWDELTS